MHMGGGLSFFLTLLYGLAAPSTEWQQPELAFIDISEVDISTRALSFTVHFRGGTVFKGFRHCIY